MGKYFKESDYNEYRYSWLVDIVLSDSEPKGESDEEEEDQDDSHSEHDNLLSQSTVNQST